MKRLSLYLFLILFTLQAPSWADDIRDFQIEGMSVGDSLLDYFSEEEIKDNTNTDYYTNNEYTSVEFFELPSFEIYNAVEFNYKTDDKKYIIAAIGGTVFCEKNIEKCNKKQKEIDSELSNMLKKSQRVDDKGKHSFDKSGKSTFVHINFWLISGDIVTIEILDWSKKITNEKRWTDNVNVSFRTKEFNDFLKIAFK
jgi:hypothetical protein